ncbi:MAG: hypothetical protein RQ729_02735 [Wenzhouxiangellaceae bacterium]|nr:hypothetical protein [Wenzhouxiangellaceae bacterium]
MTTNINSIRLWLILATTAMLAGCPNINSDLALADGERSGGDLETVNGSVSVGEGATVAGDVGTINGAVTLGANSRAEGVETVNGRIRIGDGAELARAESVNGAIEIAAGVRVREQVETVNGGITIGNGSEVSGSVRAVNGQIRLQGASVGSIHGIRGGVVLERGSRVLGTLTIGKAGSVEGDDPVLVEIQADCEVVGPLVFERPVTLRVHESARIGEVRGAEVIRFGNSAD